MPDALAADGLTPAPERRLPRHPRGVRRSEAQMDLAFVAPVLATPTSEIRGMVRAQGSIESQRAAVDALQGCEFIRWRIMQILITEGPQNARELENRNEFRHFGVCTVRKRITELKQAGQVVKVGRRDKMAVWGVVSPQDAHKLSTAEKPA